MALGTAGGAGFIACAGALFTAPPGSSITAFAQPPIVVANGGRAQIVAIVTEPAGTFVADGTLVLFFTDIGTIDAQVKTKDGVARASFVSDSRSGLAHIRVISGGTAPASAPSATPSGGGTTTPGGTVTGNGVTEVQLPVGNNSVRKVLVTADPPDIIGSRSSVIVANVFDLSGTPIANVPVIFTLTGNRLETLDSGGVPLFTDTNGRVIDVLRSRVARGDAARHTVTVTANAVGNGEFVTGTVLVPVE